LICLKFPMEIAIVYELFRITSALSCVLKHGYYTTRRLRGKMGASIN
jgi:hypothetical protein